MSLIPSNLAIAAAVTTALTLLVIGLPLRAVTPPSERRRLYRLCLLMLPMNAVAFHAVRLPLDAWLAPLLAPHPLALAWVRACYAPLTEEPAKLWPFLLPAIGFLRTREGAARDALAIGLGFGIGEAWNVAFLLGRAPEIAGLPWFALGGYIGERLMVCILHAAFTLLALHLWRTRSARVAGLLAAIGAHFAGNAPLTLAATGVFGSDPQTVRPLLALWGLLCFVGGAMLVARLGLGPAWRERLLHGTARCPGCGREYRRPLFRVNLVTRSFERCPLCRRWHLINPFADPPPDSGGPTR